MASHRIQLHNNKRSVASKHAKREIAKLLEDGKDEKATIKVEHIIRDDFTIEAYSIIELLCELVHERIRHLSKHDECPRDLQEAVCTVIWAASRIDVPELSDVKKQFKKKYGSKFVEDADENVNGCVNPRVVHKLSVSPPSRKIIKDYLIEIAKEYKVEWDSSHFSLEEPKFDTGYSIPMAPGSGFYNIYESGNSTNNNNDEDDGDRLPTFEEALKDQTVSRYDPAVSHIPVDPSIPQHVGSDASPILKPPGNRPLVSDYQPPAGVNPQVYSPPPPPPAAAQNPPPQLPPPAVSNNNNAPNNNSNNSAPSYDDLAARFAALKK